MAMNRPCMKCGALVRGASYCPTHAPGRPYSDSSYQRARLAALQRDNWTCHWCGAPGNTVDHLVPLAHGGTHHPANLVCACRTCNSRRGAHLNQ